MFGLRFPKILFPTNFAFLICLGLAGCGASNPEVAQDSSGADAEKVVDGPVQAHSKNATAGDDRTDTPPSSGSQQSEGVLLVARAQAIKEHDPQKALELLFVASDLEDSKAPALALAGEILLKTGDSKNAIGVLKAAIEADETNPDPHRWLAAYYYDLGAMDDALLHLDQVAELDQSDPKPLRMRGIILADFERHAEAIKAYELALQRELPSQLRMEIHLELAKSLLAAREPNKALKYLESLPSIAAVESARAEGHLAAGNMEAAKTSIEKALSLDATDPRALMMKANLAREQGNLDQSVATLENAIKLHPYEFDFRFHLMSAYNRQGKKEAAEEQRVAMERLRDLRTRFTELHHQSMQDRSSAVLRYELGTTAEALGKMNMAMSWYQAALALEPDHQPSQEALSKLRKSVSDELDN